MGARRRSTGYGHGFTLLEVLVVLVIIGIVAGFVVMSIGSGTTDDRLRTEAQRVVQLMSLASQTAVINSRQLGFIAGANGYHFVQLRDNRWQPFPDDRPLRPRAVPAPLYLQLSANDMKLPPSGGAPSDNNSKHSDTPEVLFLSSGENTPFTLLVKAHGIRDYYRIHGDLTGNVKMKHVSNAEN